MDSEVTEDDDVALATAVEEGWRQQRSSSTKKYVPSMPPLTPSSLDTGSDFVARGVRAAIEELLSIATPGKVTELELQRAKNSIKSRVLMNLESRAIITEDIGRQLLVYGCRKTVDHFLQCIDELTLDDITILAQRMFSSPLTMACFGDVDCVPSYESVSRQFEAQSDAKYGLFNHGQLAGDGKCP